MAELALGVIEIFSTCISGYAIVTDALSVSEDQQLLFQRMRTQRARLVVWGENWGIDEHTAAAERRHSRYSGVNKLREHLASGPAIGIQILDALNGIAELFVDAKRLQTAYGLVKLHEAEDISVCMM